MAKRGLHRSLRAVLRFSQPSSFVMTQELLISLPEAAMVRNHTYWKTGFRSFGAEKKVPHIGIRVCKSIADSFTGVNNTSATYSKKKIDVFFGKAQYLPVPWKDVDLERRRPE